MDNAQVTGLGELGQYIQHKHNCTLGMRMGKECECGLTDTLARHRLERSEPVVDSGFSADNLAVAEWLWANMPTGSRKWISLPTHEKALVCHTVQRLQGATTTPEPVAEIERLREALKRLSDERTLQTTIPEGPWTPEMVAEFQSKEVGHMRDLARAALGDASSSSEGA